MAPWFRLRVRGSAHVPERGPVLLAVNHQSDIDPLFVALALGRPLHFMTEAEKFRLPVLPPIIRRLGACPIERGQADRAGLRTALDLLEAGEAVVVFPEGNPFANLHPFHPGVALLALRGRVPVTPTVITGAEHLRPWGWVTRPTVQVAVGKPLEFTGLTTTKGSYQQVTRHIQRAVADLRLGRKYRVESTSASDR